MWVIYEGRIILHALVFAQILHVESNRSEGMSKNIILYMCSHHREWKKHIFLAKFGLPVSNSTCFLRFKCIEIFCTNWLNMRVELIDYMYLWLNVLMVCNLEASITMITGYHVFPGLYKVGYLLLNIHRLLFTECLSVPFMHIW